MKKIVVLASGSGTTFFYLLRGVQEKQYQIAALVTNKEDCGAAEKARKAGIAVWKDGEHLLAKLQKEKPDLIVLVGYLKKLPQDIVKAFSPNIINTHPALLPAYGGKGFYGIHVHEAVVQAKEKKSGVTVHLVNEAYDEGDIVAQQEVEVLPDDDAHRLAARVQAVEKPFLYETILKLLGGEN